MSKVYVNDGYMMLLDAIYFNGKKIGNVSDDGIDWGGDAAETPASKGGKANENQ